MMENEKWIITLCHKCRAGFENTDGNHIRRVDPNQAYKETCDYCNVRTGYDYEIVPKDGKGKC